MHDCHKYYASVIGYMTQSQVYGHTIMYHTEYCRRFSRTMMSYSMYYICWF